MVNWMLKKLLLMLSPKHAANWARHIVGSVAGALIAGGYLGESVANSLMGPAEAMITGAILLVIAIISSIENTDKLKKG